MITAVITDIDGVLTDGKAVISSGGYSKTICFKDLDSFTSLRADGIVLGVLTGEKDYFTQYVKEKIQPDMFVEGCKDKGGLLKEFSRKFNIPLKDICYIGDGKYDIDAIKAAGLGCCPHDAIEAVKSIADIVLTTDGGEGCISEIQGIISHLKNDYTGSPLCSPEMNIAGQIKKTIKAHDTLVIHLLESQDYIPSVSEAIVKITNSLQQGGRLLLCGNGCSAADAHHIAAELVSRLNRERRAVNAEALTVNTSSLTAVSNDYTYDGVFARQVEAKGNAGDVIIGISTGVPARNITEAFKAAKIRHMLTIALVGERYEQLAAYTDVIISVLAKDTSRIQEMHIMTGHILCEQIEKALCG